MGLTFHSYEPTLNGEGRELLVRKDCYDQQQWGNSSGNWVNNSTLRTWEINTYKTFFSTAVQAAMGNTSYYYNLGQENSNNGVATDPVFSLSITEITGGGNGAPSNEGTQLQIGATLRIAYQNGVATSQWTRTVGEIYNTPYPIFSNGGIGGTSNPGDIYGSRPCFSLPATARVNNTLDLMEESLST